MHNLLLNTFHGLNNKIVISFYKVYVTSLLDYASLIHSPYFKYLIDLLENVKRNFTERLPGLCILNYIDYLRICNIESLELRRIRSDMCFVDKLLHGLFEFNLSEFITVSSNIHNARGNCLELKTHAYLIIRLNHFAIKWVNNWNLLNHNRPILYVHILLMCSKNIYYHSINLFLLGMCFKYPLRLHVSCILINYAQ